MRYPAGRCRVVAANAAHPNWQVRLRLNHPCATFTNNTGVGAVRLDQADQLLVIAPELHSTIDGVLDIAPRHECL